MCIYSNNALRSGQFDSSWRHTLFTMFPKSGDLQQTKNWTPIAIFKLAYKIFARMQPDRLQPSMGQVGFRRGTGIERVAVCELVCSKSSGWNSEIWFANLDLTKYFDRVESPVFPSIEGTTCSTALRCFVEGNVVFSRWRGAWRQAF